VLHDQTGRGSRVAHFLGKSKSLDCLEWLHGRRCDIFSANNDGNTPLSFAVHHGQLEIAQRLYAEGADVNVLNMKGESLVYAAANKGHVAVLQWLYSLCLNLILPDARGWSPLHAAAAAGHVAAIKWLAARTVPLDLLDQGGYPPVCRAARGKQLAAVQVLLELGCSARTQNSVDGMTLAMLVACHGTPSLMKEVCARGADLSIRTQPGDLSVASFAAMWGQLEVLRWLVSKFPGFLLHVDRDGQNLFALACKKGRVEIAKWLHSIDPIFFSPEKSLCFLRSSCLMKAATLGHLEIVRYLVDELQQNPLQRNPKGTSAFMWAAHKNHVDVLDFLWLRGATCHANDDGVTSAMLASSVGSIKSLKWLHRRGQSLVCLDNQGSTTMHWAARYGSVVAGKWLLQHGVPINEPNFRGLLPVDLALANGRSGFGDWIQSLNVPV
jgi:ankyrin repeat protein